MHLGNCIESSQVSSQVYLRSFKAIRGHSCKFIHHLGHIGWVRAVDVEPGNQWFVTGANDR